VGNRNSSVRIVIGLQTGPPRNRGLRCHCVQIGCETFRGQKSLEVGTDRLSRNAGKKLPLLTV